MIRWARLHTALVLFLLVVAVGFAFSGKIGPAWDEPDNIFSGGVYLKFVQSGFDFHYLLIDTDKASVWGDRIIPNDHHLAHLPPLHNYVGVAVALVGQLMHVTPTAQNLIIQWHFATVLFFAVLVATVYRFSMLLGLSWGASVFAGLAVFLLPQLFGHGLSNSKDTAQAAMVTVSLYYLAKAGLGGTYSRRAKNLFIGAVLWGLAMGTKFNAVYVPIIWVAWSMVRSGLRGAKSINRIGKIVMQGLFIVMVGLVTLIAIWPYLWFNTGIHLAEMVAYFTTVGRNYRIIWDGTLHYVGVGKELLWWYPWGSLGLTTPLALLGILVAGIVVFVGRVRKHPYLLLLPLWIFIPLVRTFSPWSAFYDTMRHFLEILPPLMIISAMAIDWLIRKNVKLAVFLATGAVAQLILVNMTYFPYSTGYYNELASAPNRKFDRDLEALSIKDGMDYLHATYGRINVFAPQGLHLTWYYLLPADDYSYTEEKADSIILINKPSHLRAEEYTNKFAATFRLDHLITRGDMIVAYIFRRR